MATRGFSHIVLCPLMLALCLVLTGFSAQVPSSSPQDAPSETGQTAAGGESAPPPAPKAEARLPEAVAPAPVARAQAVALPDIASEENRPRPAALAVAGLDAPVPLAGMLDYFLDGSYELGVQDVLGETVPFRPWSGPLPGRDGAVWLRLPVAPMPEGMAQQIFLYTGPGVPGIPALYMSRPGSPDAVPLRSDEPGRYPLLYSQDGGTLYMRVESWPHVSFAPWAGPASDSYGLDLLGKYVCLALLGLAALICLVRGLADRREWRIWAALFSFACLAGGIWSMPFLPGGKLVAGSIPAVIAPPLALFILPLVGRHLMQPRNTMPWFDALYLLAAFAGLCMGLAPLTPGLSWLFRLHPLWPLAFAVTALLCLPAGRKGLAGWGRFLFACLLAILGCIPLLPPLQALLPITPEQAAWISLAPLCGLTLSALFLSLVGGRPAPRSTVERRPARRKPRIPQMAMELDMEEDDDEFPGKDRTHPTRTAAPHEAPLNLTVEQAAPPTAALRKKERPAVAMSETSSRRKRPEPAPRAKSAETRPQPKFDGPDPVLLTRLEETLRVPLDALLREAIALDMFPLPDEARPHVNALVAAGRDMTGIITSIARSGLPNPARVTIENAYIDLPRLLRDAHAAVAEEAEERNIAVSWYMAPHLGRRYAGPADRLQHILRLLMESAVQATERGSVQLWARRVQESNDPGHMVFTVADTGSGMPPERRNPLLPATLWELVGETGGSLHIDSTPTGTTISFSISLKALPAQGLPLGETVVLSADAGDLDETPLALPSLRLILADDVPSRRQLLAYMLEGLPHECIEARSPDEAAALHAEIPARLMLFDGNMPEKELIDAVAAIRSHDGEHELPHTVLLALVGHEAQAERLRRAGIDHILYKPVNRALLRQAMLHLAPVPGMDLPPLPEQAPVLQQETAEASSVSPESAATGMAPSVGPAPASAPESAAAQAAQPTPVALENPAAKKPVPARPEPPLTAPESVNAPASSTGSELKQPAARPEAPAASVADLAAPVPPADQAPLQDAPLTMDDALELPLPAQKNKADTTRRTLGVLNQLLGVMPRKRRPIPTPGASPTDAQAGPPAPPQPVRPASRSVGDPTPIPRRADADSAEEPQERRAYARRHREKPITPRYAPSTSDSHLSENGVGEPVPIVRPVPTSGEPDATAKTGAGNPSAADRPASAEASDKSETTPVQPSAPSASGETPAGDAVEKQPEGTLPEITILPAEVQPEAVETMTEAALSFAAPDQEEPSGESLEPTLPGHGQPEHDQPEHDQEDGSGSSSLSASLSWTGSLLDLIETVEPTSSGEDPASTRPAASEADGETPDLELPEPQHAPASSQPAPPLPAEDEQGDAVIASLLQGLDERLAAVETALESGEAEAVQATAGGMAEQAEQFGLHVLAKLARVVQEMASSPDGLEAVRETMPDLRTAVERNKLAFTRNA